jgi:hypothetical protein
MAGWGWVARSPRWHYFTDALRSLCGRFQLRDATQKLTQGNDESPDNCAACRTRVQRLKRDGKL